MKSAPSPFLTALCRWPWLKFNRTGTGRRSQSASDSVPSPGLALRRSAQRGTTLVEATVSGSILLVSLSGLIGLYGFTMKEVATSNAASVAQVNTIARLDQIKNTKGWMNFTTSTYFVSLLNTPITSTSNNAKLVREVITVASATTGTAYFTVTKNATGTASADKAPDAAILNERILNVRVRTEWSTKGRDVKQEISTLVARSGF